MNITQDEADSMRMELREEKAKIERLTAALRDIAAAYDGEQDDYDLTQTMIGIVRAALEGK